ncbi:MAG: hypothetical protein QM785_15850 [Pyrinomonadaceae bacterium]
MKHLLILTIATVLFTGACGGAASNTASNASNANAANKQAEAPPSLTTAPSDAADAFYAAALKGDCTTVGDSLTEEMKKSVGSVDAYCKSLTADGKIESAKAVGASASSESAAVSVQLTYKPEAATEEKKPSEKKADPKANTNANAEAPATPEVQVAQPAPAKTELKELHLKKIGEKWLIDVTPKAAAPAKSADSPAKAANK